MTKLQQHNFEHSSSVDIKADKDSLNTSTIAQEALAEAQSRKLSAELKKEINGPKGLEPTRYGDWEAKGRCYDF